MEGEKKKITDEERKNQHTMVNTIFIRNNVGEYKQHENSEKTELFNNINSPLKNEHGQTYSAHLPQHLGLDTSFCQFRQNDKLKCIENNCGDSAAKSLPTNNNFTTRMPKKEGTWSQKRWDHEENRSHLSDAKCGNDFDRNHNNNIKKNKKTLKSNDLQEASSKFIIQRVKPEHSRLNVSGKVKIRLPEINFPSIVPIGINQENNLPSLIGKKKCKYTIKEQKKKIKQSHEGDYISPDTLNNGSVIVCHESSESTSSNEDLFLENGNYLKEEEDLLIKSNHKDEFLMINNMDEDYLMTLINKSLDKIQLEHNKNMKREDLELSNDEVVNFIVSKSYEGSNSVYKNRDNIIVNENSARSSDFYRPAEKDDFRIASSSKNINSYRYNNKKIDLGTSQPTWKAAPRAINMEAYDSYQDLSAYNPEFDGSKSYKSSGGKNLLPVIQEESYESLLSDSPEDNIEEDYCLVDRNGRPIHLFDFRGLPLTDWHGRPLRSAYGDPLMKCDGNGVPIVDNENGGIYDMFGRQPEDEKFDPGMSPKMPFCNKLSTSDGKPLLLYDPDGRPLTSTSGTMLVDSSSRTLVRLSSSVGGCRCCMSS